MSRILIPDESLPDALALLSAERMGPFTAITGDVRYAIDLHSQMLQTSAVLMPVAALIEIALRNAVCDRLQEMFGTIDWLQKPPPPFEWRGEESDAIRKARRHAQQAGYAKRNQHQKRMLDKLAFPDGIPPGTSHQDRVKARRHKISITFGQLVAQLSFGFWKRLFSTDYEATLWDRGLKKLFPDNTIPRSKIAENLEIIYQSRNRVAHHEPVYGSKLDQTMWAVDQIVNCFGPNLGDEKTLLAMMTWAQRMELRKGADALSASIARFTIEPNGA